MGAQAVRLSNGDIDDALKERDFEVLFQPIFDLGNGALARVETFVRWRHQSLGMLPPGAFISFFETQGRMSELTRYVLAEALSAYQAWRGSHAPGFSINLALSDLSDESFASHFTVLLRERGFPAEFVTLECPMPPVDADVAAVARQLQRLAGTGARLAIEVRGRANDFLKTVRPFPFAEIKTGGAAILRFARTVRGPGLSAISELLELAAKENAAITAVGVEDQASLAALRGLGFAAAQGNHLGKVGALGQFMPSHVNDVRGLLGLEALTADDLAALFRTGAPRLAEAAAQPAPDAVPTSPPVTRPRVAAPEVSDALVERLAARIAQTDAASSRQGHSADKAAAIERARRKTLNREKLASRNALKTKSEATDDRPAPRDMQDRLSREFEALTDAVASADEFALADEGPSDAPTLRDPPLPTAVQPIVAEPAARGPTSMTVEGATARFSPLIRVSGPDAGPDMGAADPVLERGLPGLVDDRHHSHEPEIVTGDAAVVVSPDGAEIERNDAIETEIPAVAPHATWVEDSVAVEAASEPGPARKSFLNRTVIPYAALKVTHFWPRAVRRRMKKAG